MSIKMYNFKLKIIISILFLVIFQFVSAQKLSTELHSKLPASDQKKLQKADELYAKGKKMEDDIAPATKDEKKSQLKWLEAASIFQDANSTRNKVYSSNIKDFWKKYKGEKNLLDFSKKVEVAAIDSFKTAQQIRSAADKERKMTERIRLLVRAEKMESKSLLMMQKVLFTYVSWPIDFDHVWVASADQDLPQTAKGNKNEIKDKKPIKDTLKTKETTAVPKVVPPVQKAAEAETPKTKDTLINKNKEGKDISVVKNMKKSNEVVGNDSSLYGKINVSEDQVDKFNSFLEKKYPNKYEDFVINFQNLDYSDVNALKEAWYKYQFGSTTTDTAATMVAINQDTTSKGQNLANTATKSTTTLANNTVKDGKSVSKKPDDKQTTVAINTKTSADVNDKSNKTGKTNQKTQISQSNGRVIKPEISEEPGEIASGFTFRVQVAACRVALDETTIKGVYNGSLKVMELNEDYWYKYAIGQFNTYKAARQLRDQSNIPGAFVIAYLNNKRIKITPGIAYKRFTSTIKTDHLNPAFVSYRIQIAASKAILNDEHIKNIYNGSLKVQVLKENGWNKYYLSAGKTFVEASNLLNQISIPGAFILAYHQNTRIEISTATKLTK